MTIRLRPSSFGYTEHFKWKNKYFGTFYFVHKRQNSSHVNHSYYDSDCGVEPITCRHTKIFSDDHRMFSASESSSTTFFIFHILYFQKKCCMFPFRNNRFNSKSLNHEKGLVWRVEGCETQLLYLWLSTLKQCVTAFLRWNWRKNLLHVPSYAPNPPKLRFQFSAGPFVYFQMTLEYLATSFALFSSYETSLSAWTFC